MHKGEEGGNGRSLSIAQSWSFLEYNRVYIQFVSVLSVSNARMTAIKTRLVRIYHNK